MAEKKSAVSADKKILEIAKSRFNLAVEAETEIREIALDDLKFGAGDQWDEAAKSQREREQRPCLTINKMPQYIHQLVNDQRQNRPAPKVSPVDDKADIETAKILQGLIRQIERSSRASIAYTTAFDSAVRVGFGYWRLRTAYSDPKSFDQDIIIEPIRNRFSAYLDPHHQMPDGSDAEWGFIFENLAKDEYERLFGDSTLSQMTDWSSIGDGQKGWIQRETVRVAEYFYKDYRDATLVLMSDGSVVVKEDIATREEEQIVVDENGEESVQIVQVPDIPEGTYPDEERKTKSPVVRWLKINGIEILEKTDWAGSSIPIIKVSGGQIDIEGKLILEGVIRHAKDPQRMYNYWKSSETETIALAPKAPWIVAEGQVGPYEAIWKSANTRTHAYLPYKPTDIMGQPVPPPQRNVFEPPIQAITQAGMLAGDDIKATTGMYDAAIGAKSNEQSGIAIARRANQAQTSNFHFIDNLSISIAYSCTQIIELIQILYTAKRVIRVLGEDDQETLMRVGEMFGDGENRKPLDLSIGKYDVSVSTGPSFETKRQEAAASTLELAKSAPQIMSAAPDLVVKNLDLPGANELAERLKKTLPPGLVDDPKAMKIPPQAQAQMAQMDQMIAALTEQLTEARKQIDEKTPELESKERIEMKKLQVQLELEMAKLSSRESELLLTTEIARINKRLDMLGQNVPIDPEDSAGQMAEPSLQFDEGNEPASLTAPSGFQQPPTGGPSPGQFTE